MHSATSQLHPCSRRSQRLPTLATVLIGLALLLSACQITPPLDIATADVPVAEKPIKLTGTLSYSNDLLTAYHTRHTVALVDLHGFVMRDQAWPIRAHTLIFGSLTLDKRHQTGVYTLFLPAQPPGTLSDVDNDAAQGQGVKIFAVSYWSDPFSLADRHVQGWPTYLTSMRIDAENHNEVTGGKLVVWAPDGQQQFPSDFGPDQRLFTDDDLLAPLASGYSVVDMSTSPFTIDQSRAPQLPLHEEYNIAVKDFTNLGYQAAFERMFAEVRRDYAFNGIPGKAPDWDALYDHILTRVADAERQRDAQTFYLALRDFANAFHDGHVNLDGGDLDDMSFEQQAGGGYGFTVYKLDDGRVIVGYVMENGPAAQAGMLAGAEITRFDDQPIDQAIAAVQPFGGPFSTEHTRRYDQQRYLTRAPIGTRARVMFRNPGQSVATATLTAVDERESLYASSIYRDADPTALPVEYSVLDSGLGYIRISSNDDDLDLIDELFRRALDSFEYHDVLGVIIDLRQNDGGANLYLAGYLANDSIPLAQLEYYSQSSRRFEPDGPPDQIEPIENPYHFDQLAVLVGPACFSACEIEAYGFSQLPGAIVVGQSASAGVEAEVAQGQYQLPEDIWLQVPTGRYVRPDGTLFLEGAGVAPTVRVPVDAASLLSEHDLVLEAAEKALLNP
jgi:C-terminal processing protease CtpA/Prc